MKCNDKFECIWPALIGFIADSKIFGLCLCLCLFRIYNLFGKKWGFEKLYIRILRLCFYFYLLLLFTFQSLVTFFHFINLGFYFQSTWIYTLWIIIYFSICYLIKLKLYQSERKVTMFCLLLWAVSFVWKCSFLFIYLFFKYCVFC